MKAIIVGGGIGGLTTALMLHGRGIACEVYEQSETIRELGVGINTLPHAIKELAALGLLDRLDAAAIRTHELIYTNRFGQEIWREPRGLDAGYDVPQFSIHRGRLQGVIHRAVEERLGPGAIRTGCRLGGLRRRTRAASRPASWTAPAAHVGTARGDVLIGADGIHSQVRAALFPGEGPPCWNGLMLWRGATEWPAFLTGRSMIVAGGLSAKMVVYPIAEGSEPGSKLTNWAVVARVGDGSSAPAAARGLVAAGPARGADAARRALRPSRRGRARAGRGDAGVLGVPDVRPRSAAALVARPRHASRRRRAPDVPGRLQRRVARPFSTRAASPTPWPKAELPAHGLAAYEAERLPVTAEIVRSNRRGGPEGVIDAVEELAPEGFDDIERCCLTRSARRSCAATRRRRVSPRSRSRRREPSSPSPSGSTRPSRAGKALSGEGSSGRAGRARG